MNKQTYNGWTNYETWLTALWLDNEQGTQDLMGEFAEQAKETPKNDVWTREETTRFTLADLIKDFIEDNSPLASEASMYSDLMRAAIQEINFREIADSILQS